MEERSKFLLKNKLCYGCLKTVTKEDNAKNCSSRKFSKLCYGKLVTTLHGYLRKKAAINSDKSLTGDGKNEGVKCASVNTGTDVISMCVVPIKVQYCNSGKVLETHGLLDNYSQGIFILETLINNLGVKEQRTYYKDKDPQWRGHKQGNGSEGTQSNKW